jgi:hypothetical protein
MSFIGISKLQTYVAAEAVGLFHLAHSGGRIIESFRRTNSLISKKCGFTFSLFSASAKKISSNPEFSMRTVSNSSEICDT